MQEIRLNTVSLSKAWTKEVDSMPIFEESLRAQSLILDTNVLLNLLYWKDQHTKELFSSLEKKKSFALFDEETLFEFALVLDQEKFSLTQEEKENIFSKAISWGRLAETPSISAPAHCKDCDDQKFLDLAFTYKVTLLTHDKLLLKAGRRLKKTGVLVKLPQSNLRID